MYSKNIRQLTEPFVSSVITIIKQIIDDNFTVFSIRNLLAIFKDIVAVENQLKLASSLETLEYLVDSLMRGTAKQNEEVKLFKYFDAKITELAKVTRTQ